MYQAACDEHDCCIVVVAAAYPDTRRCPLCEALADVERLQSTIEQLKESLAEAHDELVELTESREDE